MRYSLAAYSPRCSEDLLRVGRISDGGYVVNERAIRASRYLLSFGLSDEWSFETHFLNLKPDVRILSFDKSVSRDVFRDKMADALNQILSARFVLGTLSFNFRGLRDTFSIVKRSIRTYLDFSRFFNGESARFFAKGISHEKTQSFVTIGDVFQLIPREDLKENSVFIKMDIEQFEFRVLPELLNFEEYVNGMVVEFHDLDMLWANFVELMDRLSAHFEVTHIHGNNYGGLIPNSTTPKVLEITFLKRSFLKEKHSDREATAYPIPGLDYPNNPLEKDYPLQF
jgi:hypothetical protein